MNKKGFSLTEILVALGLMGILGSIATVSYNGFILSTTKKTLNDSARLFVSAVDLCVKVSGGWEVKRYSQTGDPACPTGETEPCQKVKPCKAETQADLKKKLDFTCPHKATCSAYEKDWAPDNHKVNHRYYCLSIEREVSGKKIQVLARVQKDNPSQAAVPGTPGGYQILCGEDLSGFVGLGMGTCKNSYNATNNIIGKNGQPIKDKDDNTKNISNITKLLKPCEWANPPGGSKSTKPEAEAGEKTQHSTRTTKEPTGNITWGAGSTGAGTGTT